MDSLSQQEYITRARQDLTNIFEQLNRGRYQRNAGFSDKLNNDLEEVIVTDKLLEIIDHGPRTETVVSFTDWNAVKIEAGKKFLSKKVYVNLSGKGDSYWLVNGVKSSIPGEVSSEGILENADTGYALVYDRINGELLLIDLSDNNGQYLGESRDWPGRPELMKQYRENPGIIP